MSDAIPAVRRAVRLWSGAVASVLLAAAPLGAQRTRDGSLIYFEFQVERPVSMRNAATPVFPPELRDAHVEGQVLAQFVVDEHGVPDTSTFKVLKSSHHLFSIAARDAVAASTYEPALLKGSAVAQLVQQPFVFSLSSASGSPSSQAADGFRPAIVRQGASFNELNALLPKYCGRTTVRTIPVFRVLQGLTASQTQIDCEGFNFEGQGRHAEFVFSDAGLELVWIMVGAQDVDPLQRRMAGSYGESDMKNTKFTAWTAHRAALRSDVPEVLFYSDRLAERVREWFGPNSTF